MAGTSEQVDRRNRTRADAAKAAHHDAIFTLARASELHDEDTGAHLLRIRRIVEQLALELKFEQDDAESLGHDAMLHDVGKLCVPVELLQKPGQLTAQERHVMERHTIRGEGLLSDRPSMKRAARIARSHHECWDGSGYPDGLTSDAIPLEARITAVADVLDALVSARAYKQSWSYEDALREVTNLGGAKLDPTVIAALRRCNNSGAMCEIFGLPAHCVNPI
jgi:putative two-component system response regulator